MSTNTSISVSGISSGIDWRSMIDQLRQAEHRPIDVLEARKDEYSSKLTEWQSFNSLLLTLKSTVEDLKDPDEFFVYTASLASDTTTDAEDILSVSVDATASTGSYNIKVTARAAAQKLSSKSFSSNTADLGSDYAGEILINGKVISITATDSLADVRGKINSANAGTNPTGVTASILSYGNNDYRLILTSDDTGEEGISILNASSTDILGQLGFVETASGSYDVKNSITGGAQSDRFTGTTDAIDTLLELTSPPSSTTLKIRDASGNLSNDISIDLDTDNLTTIAQAINNDKGSANISASVVSETVDGTTYYRLQIDGIHASDPFSDNNHVFETLGLIKGGVGDVLGASGTNEMTTDGQVITSSTLLTDIDGYMSYTAGDQIAFSGTKTDGTDVSASAFSIQATSTVQDLLDAIESAYGDVSASVQGDGTILITDDSTSSSSSLVVTLTDSISDGSLDFGFSSQSASTIRKRQIQAGQDAAVEIDGVTATSSENTIEDLIPGVTLDLLKADTNTTVTLTIGLDQDAMVEKVQAFVDSYNEVAAYIQQQRSYDADAEEAGGVLFGDATLNSIRRDLTSVLITQISGLTTEYSTLGLVGVNLDSDGQLSLDEDTFTGYLETNANDIKNLFTGLTSTSTSTLEYVSHSNDTQAGTYTVNITQAATKSSSTSDTAVSGTLGSDETLTITSGDDTANISLTGSMTIDDIVNAINTELDDQGIEVTASKDASNHVVLTHDYYGSNTFSISETGDLLWTGGDQTVNNGLDVAGTINGESATGSGQILKGDSDEDNIDGLEIKYTGSGTGEIGTVTVVIGAAEQFDRTLYNITDSLDGYLASKQESIQNTINNLDDQIDLMEDRLDRKMEVMVNQFIFMEQAMATMQNQSEWLSGQLSAALRGWA
ncbi:MAG: flagellar filament capping protein FliD [Deltaproteobacteria bacterium]|nr:flagellar filament capping protein FliD [Deltaproteobacteria bacterium]